MNDEYLKSFRKSPDTQWIERIHARLERRERKQALKRYSILFVLTLIFTFGMLMTFSATVRAEVIMILMKIGGVQYEVGSDYPGYPGEPEVELATEHLSWDQARGRFLSPLQLPTYVPHGYEQEADIDFFVWGNGDPALQVIWRKEGQPLIGLFINQCTADDQGCGMAVGPGGLEEITIHGKPAAVVRGSWDVDKRQYDLSGSINVVWRYNENTVYQVWSSGQSIEEELIKMAESIP